MVEPRMTVFATALLLFWNGLRSPIADFRSGVVRYFDGRRYVYRFPARPAAKDEAHGD